VICVDEFGPLNLQPRPGRGWFPHGRPARQRATYTGTNRGRQMFTALDLATGQMSTGSATANAGHSSSVSASSCAAASLPGSSTWSVTEVRTWCAANDIELVYTPTNTSWLNWIAREFTAARYLTRHWTSSACGQDTLNFFSDLNVRNVTGAGHHTAWKPNDYGLPESKIRQSDTGPFVGSNVVQIFRRLIHYVPFHLLTPKDTPANITQ
jgi:hypothetical protein